MADIDDRVLFALYDQERATGKVSDACDALTSIIEDAGKTYEGMADKVAYLESTVDTLNDRVGSLITLVDALMEALDKRPKEPLPAIPQASVERLLFAPSPSPEVALLQREWSMVKSTKGAHGAARRAEIKAKLAKLV